jgi:hypothetical protein
MKWRNPLAYLLVLLLLGGYYYYFEVVQEKQKEMAAMEAKKVFHFQAEGVSAFTIEPKGKETLKLRKEPDWQVVAPIKAEADKSSVDDFLSALSKLEAERDVVNAPEDLRPFGLQEPSLAINFQAGERKLELLVGDKNPVGDGSYAKTSERPRVFLIAEGNRSALNRGLNELRRRQLFTFQLSDVAAVTVAWHDGNTIAVELEPNEREWKAPEDPKVRIKKSKMDNIIEQIHWLRAQSFLENEPGNLSSYGLEPPLATVTMRLKSGEKVVLSLAKKDKDAKQIAALSSQLPSPVQVAAGILNDLPKDLGEVQDRSLLGFKPDATTQVDWQLGDLQGRAVRLDEGSWGLKKGEGPPEPMKDSWHVRSLLWDLGDGEYQKKLDPAPPLTPNPNCRIELRNAEPGPLALSWEKPPAEGRDPAPVWVQKEGVTTAVGVDAELLRRVEGDLGRLSHPEATGSK